MARSSKLLVTTIIFLLLMPIVTSCARSTPEPAPSPIPGSAPIPMPTPNSTPASPSTLTPAEPTPTPPEEIELDLVETVPSSYQLDVTPIYAGHDVCMLGSLGMIAKYVDPSLDFCDIVGCSGIGPTGYFMPDKPTGLKFTFVNGHWAGMVFAPRHLGFSLILGIADGGKIDESPSPDEQARIEHRQPDTAHLALKDIVKRIEYFDNVDDAFNFLKKVIASGYPVEVHLNVIPVMHDFAKVSDNWVDHCKRLERDDTGSHFMVVAGYDSEYVYLNDPTDPGKPANLPATICNFKSAWDVPKGTAPNNTGPYWMLFIKNIRGKESADSILAWSKERAKDTPRETCLLSEDPLVASEISSDKTRIHVISEMRLEYSKFLAKNGKGGAAALYEQSGKLWVGLLESSSISDDLKKIADLEERAQQLY